MCIYTYHHYPLCGHISNWTVTSCLEFTSQLRLRNGTGDILCCNDVEVNHDLHPTAPHSLCARCDYEWAEAMTSKDPDAFQSATYRTIEGLGAKSPVIEFGVRMTFDVGREVTESHFSSPADDEAFADVAPVTPSCHSSCCCCCCSCQSPGGTHSSSVDPATQDCGSGTDSAADVVSDSLKQLEDPQDEAVSPPETGEEFDISNDELPSPEVLTTDILRALAETSSTEDVTDCPSVYSRDTSSGSSDTKAVDRSTEGMNPPQTRNTPSSELKRWDAALSDVSSLPLLNHARYGWLADLDLASVEVSRHLDEVEGRVRVQFETGDADSTSQGSSSTNRDEHDIFAVREYKASIDRPGTPYTDMDSQCTTPRRFIAAASEKEAHELGLRYPLRIGNLYSGF